MESYLFYDLNIFLESRQMEKQIVNIFLLLGFNYYMIKSWGTRKVTLLTIIGNYFLISILIESYFGLPKFIEDFNALFMLGIGMIGTYILWRKNKAGTLTEYEKRGWNSDCTFLALFVLSVLVGVLVFLFMKYIYGIYI